MNAVWQQMVHTWMTGGWVLASLSVLAVLMYATAANLLMILYNPGLNKASDEEVRGWVSDPSRAPARIRELIRYSQDEVESLRDIEGRFREVESSKFLEVDRRLASLAVMVVAAPL